MLVCRDCKVERHLYTMTTKEYYEKNKEKSREYQRKYRKEHPEKQKEYKRRYLEKHGKEDRERRNKRARELKRIRPATEQSKQKDRELYRAKRRMVLDHYGKVCHCCQEDKYEFLAIDHINGGGNKHKKEIGRGERILAWLIRNNYPEGFRVLCHNCNQALGHYGFCPHQNPEPTNLAP